MTMLKDFELFASEFAQNYQEEILQSTLSKGGHN